MNAKHQQTNRRFPLKVRGGCGQCGETIFSMDRKQVMRAIFREIPLPLGCRQCGSVRVATSAERSALGYFLSEETLPIDLTDVVYTYADKESRAVGPLVNCGAD
jgi:hypothetical protein